MARTPRVGMMDVKSRVERLQATCASGLGCLVLGYFTPNSWVVHTVVVVGCAIGALRCHSTLHKAGYLNAAAGFMVIGSASLVADCLNGGFKDVRLDAPTAICMDGTYSYSANRSGTCSWHGGVAEWYPYIPPRAHPWWLGF
jgi:hypothetical protein